jgi:hypothetical protein
VITVEEVKDLVVVEDRQCKCTKQSVVNAKNLAKCLLDLAVINRFFVVTASKVKIMTPEATNREADRVVEILKDMIPVAVVAAEEVMATEIIPKDLLWKCMKLFAAIVAKNVKSHLNLPEISRSIVINVLAGIRRLKVRDLPLAATVNLMKNLQ